MKQKIIFAKLLSLLLFLNANAQSTLDSVLAEILNNNKTILAAKQNREAQKLYYKTGLTPANPTIEYDYSSSKPASAGNQTEFTVAQSFDFPSVYVYKSQLAKQQAAQAEFQLEATRQDILLEAKIICIELVYRNKLNTQLTERTQNISRLLGDFNMRLDKGDGNIMDVNKAQIQLIGMKREYQENISMANQLNQKLAALNGGIQISFGDTSYFPLPAIQAFEQVEKDFEAADPLRKILEQEKVIAQKRVNVSRSMSLPKFEAGYHYQGILGQKYNGIHAGMSVPLWENKNTVKYQKSRVLFADRDLEEHRNAHYYEIKQLYEKYQNLNITLTEYRKVFQTLNSSILLNKALALGQISTIEYFMELNYYSSAMDNYLLTEKEYYIVIAELYKYTL